MSNFSNDLEQKLLGVTLCHSAYTGPNTLYVALFLACTNDGESVTEVETLTGYGRKTVDFKAPSAGAAKNDGAITYTEATTVWGTVTHIGIYDAFAAGNLLYWGILDTSKLISNGDTFQISDEDLTVTLD